MKYMKCKDECSRDVSFEIKSLVEHIDEVKLDFCDGILGFTIYNRKFYPINDNELINLL